MNWGTGHGINHNEVRGYAHLFSPHPLYGYCCHFYTDSAGRYAWTCNKSELDHD